MLVQGDQIVDLSQFDETYFVIAVRKSKLHMKLYSRLIFAFNIFEHNFSVN